jgi:dolichol kinase/phosphoserine phosphatase
LKKEKKQIVVFDVEGVIIPKIRFILFEIAGRKGLLTFIKVTIIGLLFGTGLITLKRALEKAYGFFKGFPLVNFLSIFNKLPLLPGVKEVIENLKKDNYQVILISSSIPRLALESLAKRIKVDYVSGLELGISEGLLTGEIWGDVIRNDGKAIAFKTILKNNPSLDSYSYLVGVADDRNNLSLFKICDLKIGFNPDFVLSYKSDFVVKYDLLKILPLIKNKQKENLDEVSKKDLIRKIMHIGGFFISLISQYFFHRYIVALIIFFVSMVYLISEFSRMFGRETPIISQTTLRAARKSEYQEFVSAPLFYALGIILALVFFPESIGYVSITVLTFGDGFASIFGGKWGKKTFPFNKGKKIEGTIFGFLFAVLGSLLFVDLKSALIASAVGLIIEALPLPLDDNLTIPVFSGLSLLALG